LIVEYHGLFRAYCWFPDLDGAEMKRGSAADYNREFRGFGVGVDLRFAANQPCGGIGTRRERRHGPVLGGRPRRLAKDFPGGKSPVSLDVLHGIGADGHVLLRRSKDFDVDVGDPRGQAGINRQRDVRGLRRAIDGDVDLRRKVALRCSGLARLGQGLAREAVEQFLRHVRVVLPTNEVDGCRYRAGDSVGGNDLDAIADRIVGVRLRRGDRRFGRGGRRVGLGVSGERCAGRRQHQRAEPEARRVRASCSGSHIAHYHSAPLCGPADPFRFASTAT
jgi:hypothetical protein